MTQLELADIMGVSYQAVSNWERANSMLDIGKLESLCEIFSISLEELLGSNTKTANIKEIMKEQDGFQTVFLLEELQEIVSMLKPDEAEKQVLKSTGKKKMNLS